MTSEFVNSNEDFDKLAKEFWLFHEKKLKTNYITKLNDTDIIITSPSCVEFSTEVNTVCADINEWFRSNLFSLNFDITHFLQF
jgi:hypothetical protein